MDSNREKNVDKGDKKSKSFDEEMRLTKPKSEDEEVIVKDDDDIDVKPLPPHHSLITENEDTFRGKLQRLLHSHNFHCVIIALVLTDCVLVICELILDLSAVENENKVCEEGSGDEHDNEEETAEKELTAALVLHYLSIAILSIFIVELFFKLYAFQLNFFKHKLEVFDAVIVIVSFVLDIVFLIYEETFMAVIQLLIFLRLWRIVRIVNGLVLSVEAKAHEKITAQKLLREEAEVELEKLREHCEQQEKQLQLIIAEAKKHGIVLNSTQKVSPPMHGKQMEVEVDMNDPPAYSTLHETTNSISLSVSSSNVTYEAHDENSK